MQKLFRSISRHRSSPKGQTKILTKLLKVKQCSFALFNIVLNNSRPRLFPKSLFFPKSKKKTKLVIETRAAKTTHIESCFSTFS